MCPRGRLFTEREDAFLRTHSGTMPSRELAKRLGRSVRAVQCRCRKLGLRKWQVHPFTADEDRLIRSAKGRTSVEIARLLGRTPAVIRMRALRLGLGQWKSIKPNATEYRGYKIRNIRKSGGKYIRIPEHRAVMEEYLNRRLADSERVHHIDLDKRNNGIANLYLCSGDAEHRRIHHSLSIILTELFRSGAFLFDRDNGVYRPCEIRK